MCALRLMPQMALSSKTEATTQIGTVQTESGIASMLAHPGTCLAPVAKCKGCL